MLCAVACLLTISIGSQASYFKNRIIGGNQIDITQVPYQVSLIYNDTISCGGVILRSTVIITAAHCLANKTSKLNIMKVRAGSAQWHRGGTVHFIQKFAIHPEYEGIKQNFDAALILIKPPLHFDATRKSIKILNDTPEEGDEVTLSGWGRLQFDGKNPKNLQSVTVSVTDYTRVCRRYANIGKGFFCFGDQKHGLCSGDSGGPVVKNSLLVGIATASVGCPSGRDPSVGLILSHKKVAPWITSTIEKWTT